MPTATSGNRSSLVRRRGPFKNSVQDKARPGQHMLDAYSFPRMLAVSTLSVTRSWVPWWNCMPLGQPLNDCLGTGDVNSDQAFCHADICDLQVAVGFGERGTQPKATARDVGVIADQRLDQHDGRGSSPGMGEHAVA